MDKKYVIHWKSKTNGRTGNGSTCFTREEAGRLAEELNQDYPEIEHEARNAAEVAAEAAGKDERLAGLATIEEPAEPISAVR